MLSVALTLLVALQLSACATLPSARHAQFQSTLPVDTERFGPRPDIVDEVAVFTLSEAQQHAFLDYFYQPLREATPPHERVHDYLLQITRGFDFHNDTRTASQVLSSASGNCLSLAILTTALADLVEIDVDYQLVDGTPVFEQRGDIVSRGVHVRSILYDPRWQKITDGASGARRPGIRFDYFPEDTKRVRLIGNLPYEAYVAMYYSNVAGEALAAGDRGAAFWLLREALRHDPGNAIALNTLAVVYRHAGDAATAERIYRYAIEHLPEKASFLRNYVVLLTRQDRRQEALEVSARLERLDDQNPFSWVAAGREAMAAGDYREAARYFEQALDIAPYLHEAHAQLAIAYLHMGKRERAEQALGLALENAPRRSTRSLYEAKLAVLDRRAGTP
ncbi:MAG: tetratricopeptide repeat protein [Pseudomonadota bacterium]